LTLPLFASEHFLTKYLNIKKLSANRSLAKIESVKPITPNYNINVGPVGESNRLQMQAVLKT
jgi:hypothetical protein